MTICIRMLNIWMIHLSNFAGNLIPVLITEQCPGSLCLFARNFLKTVGPSVGDLRWPTVCWCNGGISAGDGQVPSIVGSGEFDFALETLHSGSDPTHGFSAYNSNRAKSSKSIEVVRVRTLS
jgi:hypothetical protein